MVLDESMIDLVRETLMITLKIAAPILLGGMVIGLLISVLQSITSVQDQTLSFVPKIVVMAVVSMLLLPWIVQRLLEYMAQMFSLA